MSLIHPLQLMPEKESVTLLLLVEPDVGFEFPEKEGGPYSVLRRISRDPLSNHLAFEVADKNDKRFFVKLPKIPQGLEQYELSHLVASINSSYIAERNNNAILEELRGRNPDHLIAPLTLEVNDLGRRQAHIPFIVQELIPGTNIKEVIKTNELFNAPRGARRCLKVEHWLLLAEKMVDTVRKLHNNQIYHGDIKPKKFIVTGNNIADAVVTLTDFGSSMRSLDSVMPSHVPENTFAAPELIVEKKTFPNGESDIYSIGGVLYYLATGEDPPSFFEFLKGLEQPIETWNRLSSKDNELWKTKIHTAFAENAQELITEGYEIIVKIIDKCLRPRPGERYATLERLRMALSAIRPPTSANNLTMVAVELGSIQSELSKLDESFHPFFQQVLHSKLQIVQKELRDMRNAHYELSGEREDLIDELVKYMSFLGSHDEYITITVPEYWAPNNLGVNGRFLTLNKDLVRRGVHIRRLFLTCPEDFQGDNPAYEILERHQESLRDFDKSMVVAQPKIEKGLKDKPGTIWVGCQLLQNKATVTEILREFQYVAIWKRTSQAMKGKDQEMIAITFTLRRASESQTAARPPTSEICKVRFKEIKNPSVFGKLLKYMEANPRSLDEVMKGEIEAISANKKEATPPPFATRARGKYRGE